MALDDFGLTLPPPPARPSVKDVLPLVHRLYRGDDACTTGAGCVGGHLHIVLDDSNIETPYVTFCLAEANKDGCGVCAKIAELMLRMSLTQRYHLSVGAYER